MRGLRPSTEINTSHKCVRKLLVTSPHHLEGVCGMMTFREYISEPSKLTLERDESTFYILGCDLLYHPI